MKRLLLLGAMVPSVALAGGNEMYPSRPAQHQSQSIDYHPTMRAAGNTGTISSTAQGGHQTVTSSGGAASGNTVNIAGSGAGNGGSSASRPPDVALSGIASSGQCAIVGGGPGVSTGGGGGGFLIAYESLNCRNYYIALAWIQAGISEHDSVLVNKGVRLMASITDKAEEAYNAAPNAVPVSYEPPAPIPAAALPHSKPEWCYTSSPGELRHRPECK